MLLRILNRSSVPTNELYELINDSKTKRACVTIGRISEHLSTLEHIIDPYLTGVPNNISEYELAGAHKKWFAINRNNLLSAMSSLSVAFEEYAMLFADASVAVEEATDLNSSLQKLYSFMLKGFEEITKLLGALESTSFLEEILSVASELRRSYSNLKLILTNQVILPALFALREEAREDTLNLIAVELTRK